MRLRRIGSASTSSLFSLVLILSVFLAAMIGATFLRPTHAGADYTINAVYLAGASPVIDTSQTRQAGIRIVSTVDALQAEAATAHAVIIDQESMSAVSGEWLADQVQQGKLIVGLNIPIVELAAYVGYQSEPGRLERYLQDYGGRPFYAWFYERTERSHVNRSGTGSDIIYSTEDFLARLRSKSVGSQTDYTPPRSPSELPLPTRPPR